MEKIFEPFFTTKEQSSGLGLTTASSIIEGHDGYITVESSSGSGTIFHIYMPAATETPGGEAAGGKQLSLGRRRILVMDDEELVRTVAERMLDQCGCSATFAGDGEEMLARYREAFDAGRPFDAVIVDLLVSSGMGGKEAIAELLRIDPHARAIVSSGYSDDPIMEQYRDFGFQGILPKPYLIPALKRVLYDVIIGTS
jgi:CheY-like chemotaxis protein